jgi:hypothetical protein
MSTARQTPATGANDLVKHPLPQRLLHWFNAACFLFLWLTGIGLVTSTGYRVAPEAYVDLIQRLFGSNSTLLRAHVGVGATWLLVMGASLLADPYGLGLRFLRDLVPTRNDLAWFRRKPVAELRGDSTALPPQGAYNAGQKAFGVTVVLGGAAIAATGVLMVVGTGGGEVARWMVLLHLLAVGAVMAFFFVHLTMAAFLREERPALASMVRGTVSRDYAEHHHREWLDAHGTGGGEPIRPTERFGLPRAAARLVIGAARRLAARETRPEWSPYAAGVGIGLTVLAAFVLTGHGLGASGLLSRLGAHGLALVAPDHVAANAYWGPVLGQGLADYWLLWAVVGVVIGGFVSSALGGRLEAGLDRGALISPGARIALAVFGGALVGFATRFTRGCTSHQALSGGALLSLGSWVFMLSVFAGGFAAAFFLRRVWR